MAEAFVDVPLPGLDLPAAAGRSRSVGLDRRAYSSTLEPTPEAVRRFWTRVVKAPGNGCWVHTGAVSGVDGYSRDRAIRRRQPHRIGPPLCAPHRRRTRRRGSRGAPLQRTALCPRRPGAPHRLHPGRKPALRRRVRAHRIHPEPRFSPRSLRPFARRPRRCRKRLGPHRLQSSLRQHCTDGRSPTVLTRRRLTRRQGPARGGVFVRFGRGRCVSVRP